MKTKFVGRILTVLFGLTGLLFLASGARADEGDPPSRVARISYVNGSVSLQPGGAGDWGTAAVNRPMTIGDRIWTDSGSRAELQAGAAAIHLNESTALSFLNLDDRTTQMRMAEGQVNFRVRELRSDELYEVDTPNLTFTVIRAGAFRVDVSEAGDFTGISVLRGEGEITAGGRTYKLHEGERGEFRGVENPQYNIDPAPRPDSFDRWAMDRDLRGERSVSSRYVSRDVVGYEDLDEYGTWRDSPGYGHVWYPTAVYDGWAPYRYGNWNWVDPWGWTWVDYSPWGFAPYHYGRWAYINGYWGWCPGPVFVRPIYSPAFVAFVGGRHFGLGFGFGQPVAWFPLGFGEPFFPWFRSSRVFVTNINITNTVIRNVNGIHTTNVRNVNFVHAHNVNAVTAVSRRTFANGEAVNRASVRVTPEMLRNAQVTTRAEVNPTQRSFRGASAGGRIATPPAAVENRSVITRATPAMGARNLAVRPANPGGQVPARTTANAQNSPIGGRRGSPEAPAVSPRQRELALDKPQRTSEGGRGTMIPPQARGQGDARSADPRNSERLGGRPPDRTPGRTPDRTPGRTIGGSAERPNVAPQGRVANPNRPPEVSRPIPDRNPSGRESTRPASAPPTPSEAPVRPAARNEKMTPSDRPPSARGGGSGVPDARQQGNIDRGSRESTRPNAPSTPRTNDRSFERSAPSRSYEPPRSYSRPAPSNDRSYRAPESPQRSYSAPPQRSYSGPPQGSYSAPSRSYSAPRGSSSGPFRGSSGGSSSRGVNSVRR
jgi:hypothetical protein